MADPLSITASVVAVVTAATTSARSLNDTVKRFKDRDKTLQRLQEQLEDLLNILETLEKVSHVDTSTLSLLKGPVSRCSQICHDFESSMKEFHGKAKAGFRDWAKMEFMRGNINDFMDTVTGYKLTITVGLGTITMHTSKLSHQVLEEYHEMIKDTTYNLNLHLQRIDEKMAALTGESTKISAASIDLKDERAVTKQCLRICEDAKSYLESLSTQESCLQDPTESDSTSNTESQFGAQLLTRQTLNDHRDHFAEIIGRMRERLDTLPLDGTAGSDRERLRLQEDIDISKQCLEVCKRASNEVSRQKIYKVREAVAEEDSDQVVVTTLADLFDVGKALSRGRSAQLLGLVTDETLQKLSDQRYSSRFGAVIGGELGTVPSAPVGSDGKRPIMTVDRVKTNPNEMRKRTGETQPKLGTP